MKWCIQAGHFGDDYSVTEALDQAAVAAVLARFADRDDSGVSVPSHEKLRFTAWVVLGFVEREAILCRTTGVAEVNLIGSSPRLNGFLAVLCRELDCRLLDSNNGGWVTDYFLGLADGQERHTEPGTTPDPAGR